MLYIYLGGGYILVDFWGFVLDYEIYVNVISDDDFIYFIFKILFSGSIEFEELLKKFNILL